MSQQHFGDFDEFKDIGRQIKNSVRSAVNQKEFSELKATIQSTMHEVQAAFQSGWQQPPEPDAPFSEKPGYTDPAPPAYNAPRPGGYTDPGPPPSRRQAASYAGPPPMARPAVTPPPSARPAPPKAKKERVPGGAAGVLLTVFGSIGLGLSILSAMGILALALNGERLYTLIVSLLGAVIPLFLASVVFMAAGSVKRHRVRRYRRYREQLGGCAFCPIEVLASYTGNTPRFVAKDLRRMIRLGMMPDAHVDDEGTCLMLDFETYQAYLNAKQKQAEAVAKQSEATERSEELQALIAEEQRTLAQIRACNDEIPGEFISAKITCLENTTAAIFRYVEEHPAKLPEIRRFLNYYLPTTLKLLEAYKKFSAQTVSGSQQRQTKAEIESTMDTINLAFANLLDGLMQEERMDVSADITVMKTMMEQEGLTGKKMDS